MSRYPGNDYPRDRRPSPPPARWNPDRRTSYHEGIRGGRGRELRDAPPLGGRPPNYRDPRDFSPRDEQPRLQQQPPPPRRNSRDGPPSATTYSDPPPFRGGYRGGWGRGDGAYRSERGGRARFDDRDLFRRERSPQDRSPPPRWRSPDRRDDRYVRRDDNRWPERDERDRDADRARRPELSRIDSRAVDASSPASASAVNPERMALITDPITDNRRPGAGNNPPSATRRESELPSYLNARADATSSKYGSRASSPPTQPPAVPAFGFVLGPATSTAEKTVTAATAPAVGTDGESAAQQAAFVAARKDRDMDVTAIAPRGPRSAMEPTPPLPRLQSARSNESISNVNVQATSPTTTSRPAPKAVPTAPKADRALSQTSLSPHVPFAPLNNAPSQPSAARPRSPPPPTAPTGPKAHVFNTSPDVSFVTAPTAPRADRLSFSGRHADRNVLSRNQPPARAGNWNQWRRHDLNEPTKTEVRHAEPKSHTESDMERRSPVIRNEDKMDVDQTSQTKPATAQQSFFGQPRTEIEEDLDADALMDDSASSSEEDELEIEDNVLWEAKFVRQRRELEAKLVDLSSQEYRATTPLENLARLSRIVFKDIVRLRESGMLDLDAQPTDDQSMAPAEQSSASDDPPEVPTPKGDEDASVEIEDGEEDIVKRIRRPSPEVITLPFMMKGSQARDVDDSDAHHVHPATHRTMVALAAQEEDDLRREEDELVSQFSALYLVWRQQCEELDHEREELERLVRQVSEAAPESESAVLASVAPVLEGRRSHKFSSELELQEALRQSEETARLEQERHEREAKKFQADLEKEAVIPDQINAKELRRSLFIDNNRLRDPESLTVIFAYEPAPDDFTEDERAIFLAAYKETPKKWSEIASLLPGREPKHCIRHYYANKWDGRFRDGRNRKRAVARRGRAAKGIRSKGSAAMADMSRADELASGPVVMSDSGRPKRAAAPTTFGEKESEAKALLAGGPSPAKRAGPNAGGKDGPGDEKPAKRRRNGDKPTRKPKGQPVSLAAAPTLSPDSKMQPTQSKELDRSRLEDASLLTSFHAGRPLHPEHQTMFSATPESYMHRPHDERMRALAQSQSAKPSPSSYWSVPEQTDFNKYIKHFGTDFTAIAQHMGTKTHTMIKNHYQRQIDGGNRPELEQDALAANARRDRGEDLGPPPVPTPITKRKYDQPATATGRSLAPFGDPMEIDEGIGARPAKQQGSPPQFAVQPRFPAATALPQQSRFIETTGKPYQPRVSWNQDSRGERTSTFMPATSSATAGQPSRTALDAQDPAYLQGLRDEQQRALMQGHYQEQERADSYHHRSTIRGLQQSPRAQPVMSQHLHGDRKPILQDPRANSPPSGYFPAAKPQPPRGFEASRYPTHQYTAAPVAPKREDSRASIGSSATGSFSQQGQAPAPAEPPKRSNVMSLLNDTPEDTQPKRNSLDQPAPPLLSRHASPGQHSGLAAPPYIPSQSRVDAYGQTQYSRSSIPGPAVSSALKQEPLSATTTGIAGGIPPPTSVHGTLTPPSAPSYDRSGRPYYSQHSMLGQMSTSGRANPSPPPHAGLQHSRTPSMPTAETAQRSTYLPGPPTTQAPLYPSQQQYQAAPISQPPPHEPSGLSAPVNAAYGSMTHQRAASRDDRIPYPIERDRRSDTYVLDREALERDWRPAVHHKRMLEMNQRLDRDRMYQQQHGGPPISTPSQPYGTFGAEPRASLADGGMREQSRREAMLALQQQEERERSFREQREREQADDAARRRHDEAYLSARRTPLNGGYGLPGSGIPPPRR